MNKIMMNIAIIAGIVFILALISFMVFIVILCKNKLKLAKDELSLKKKQFFIEELSSTKIEDIQKILELLITECFEDYLASNPEYASSNYISEEVELKMIKDIGDRVIVRMSEGLYNKITLYYNEKVITDLIAEKIYLRVTNYIVSVNTTKK